MKPTNLNVLLAQKKQETIKSLPLKLIDFEHPQLNEKTARRIRNLFNPPSYRSRTVRLGIDFFGNPILLVNPKGNLDSPTVIDEWEDCSLSEAAESRLKYWWSCLPLKEQSNRNLVAIKLAEICCQ